MKTGNEKQKKLYSFEPTLEKRMQQKKKRVCAYCRVSTDLDNQINSFWTQKEYYEQLIGRRTDWELVDIYADYGKSGTTENNRTEFERMLADCRQGEIDLILTKSITRFARNTMDCIREIRMLKELGIGVYFEKENVNTLSEKSEVLLTILSSVAQAESESISTNERWSIQRSFMNGTFSLRNPAYGYKRGTDKQPEINEETAAVVCQIYESFLSGKGVHVIAKELTEQKIPTKTGKGKWTDKVVWGILNNPIYCGDMLYQKYYNTTTLPYKQKRNWGEMPQILIEDNHEAIVSRETFERVQEIMAYRSSADDKGRKYEFSGKILCGCCGGTFYRRKLKNKKTDEYSVIQWNCCNHIEDAGLCGTMPVKEEIIKEKFVVMWNKLAANREMILGTLLGSLYQLEEAKYGREFLAEYKNKMMECKERSRLLHQLMRQEYIDSVFYIEQQKQIKLEMGELQKKNGLLQKNEISERIKETKRIMQLLSQGPKVLEEYDETLFLELVDRLEISPQREWVFQLKNGLNLTEDIKDMEKEAA